jgi:CHAT domain-containing protein
VAVANVGLAFAQSAQDKFVEATASYRRGIEMFTAQRRFEAAARAEIGLSAALLGNKEAKLALEAAERARRAAVELENDDVLWRARLAEARGLRSLGQRPPALEAVAAAAEAVDRLVQSATLRPSARVSRDSAAVFALRGILEAESGDAAAAFESAERLRVHELRVTLSPAARDITPGMTDAERSEERTALAEIASWDAQLTRERGQPKPDPARLERLRKGLDDATALRLTQQQQLFDRLRNLRIWRGLLTPASRADVEPLLGPSAPVGSGGSQSEPAAERPSPAATPTLLVQLVVDDADLLLLWVRRGQDGATFSASVAPIARRALAERVSALVQPETLRNVDSWRKASAEFVAILPPALIEALTQSTRTIVMPHEVLWRVPFEALMLEARYLGDASVLSYAASVTSLIRPPAPPSRPPDIARVLVSAGAPAVARSLQEFIARTTPEWTLRDTLAAERELTTVAAGGPSESARVIVGAAATESAVRAALPAADVIHLAVPFRINGASPLFSSMLFAEEPALESAAAGADGTIELHDVMNLALHARVAVLSDGTAMAMREAADDAATVQWGWRAAGVPALLLSRWSTDRGSDALLAAFHRRLQAGLEPTQALHAARAELRAGEPFQAPYYWAGWLLFD